MARNAASMSAAVLKMCGSLTCRLSVSAESLAATSAVASGPGGGLTTCNFGIFWSPA
jgi:hypothetical protein